MHTARLLAVLCLCACGPSMQPGAGGVTLAVQPGTVTPADSVVLTLRNGSSAEVGYNLCTSALERQDGESWRAVPSDRVCTMELRMLAPGAEATYSLEVPSSLVPGEYRYLTMIEVPSTGERSGITSEPFRVAS